MRLKLRQILKVAAGLALAGIVLMTSSLALAGISDVKTRLTNATDTADRDAFFPSLNADGTKIVFGSDADFFAEGIPDQQFDLWLYDTATMTVTRLTTASDANRVSERPSMSADGTKIAFVSDSDFLGQGILDGQTEVWLYDTATMTVTRVTTASDPALRDAFFASISGDGTKVAFQSDSDFLGQGILDGQIEIWLYDTATMTVTRIAPVSDGATRDSANASVNADGTKIAFNSDSDFLGQGAADDRNEIWLYDTATMTVTRLTTISDNDRESQFPHISADGTKVVFYSDSDFLGQGIANGQYEIWLYDTTIMTLTRVTTASDPADRDSQFSKISADGTKITFQSDSDFFGQGNIIDNQNETWVYDTATMTVTRVTTASAPGLDSSNPVLNSDGAKVTFHSDSDFLGQGIAASEFEVWLFSEPPPITNLSLNKEVDPTLSGPGGSITYTISFTNNSLVTATNVVITDSVPISVTGSSLNYISSGAAITATGGASYAWQVQDLGPNQSGTITITGQLSSTLPHNHAFANTALITTTVIDSDPGDNSDSATVTIDAAAPEPPMLLSPVDGTATNTNDLTLTWAASLDAAGYWLNLSGTQSDVGNVTSAATGILADGVYTWTVAAYDQFDNTSPFTDVWSFTVDTVPPETTITVTPPDPDNDPTPSFEFIGDDGAGSGVASFECQVDGGGWTGCTSPTTTGSLGDGSHTFEVRATDNAGNTDATPDSYTWTVDITGPSVISVSPAGGSSDVLRNLPFVINFDEAMNTASASYLFTPTVTGLAETWTNGDTRLTLTHDVLAANTQYTATITAGSDLAGNPLANAPYTWVFTTSDVSAPEADLALGKARAGAGDVNAGGRITYTLTITNAGPTSPVTATIVDTFSNATALAAVSGAGCTWTPGSAVVTCTLTNIASSGPVQLALVVTTSGVYSGALSNSASISAEGGVIDPTLGNNDAGPILVNIVPFVNTPPTISDIPDQSSSVDQVVGPVAFTVTDAETPATNLTLSGASSNSSLVPAGNIGFGGSGTNRTLTLTPTTGLTGAATITVTVSDGDLQASDDFVLTVTEGASRIYLPILMKN